MGAVDRSIRRAIASAVLCGSLLPLGFRAAAAELPATGPEPGGDPVVTRDESRALYEAAAGPKEWREYDCGHDPDGDPRAVADRAELFAPPEV